MKRKIGFIGAGNMGSAIMRGAAASPLKDEIEIYTADPDEEKVNALSECGVKKCENAAELSALCDIVFLAVKPQILEDVLKSIKGSINENAVYVSIAAGITAEFIRNTLENQNLDVVLVMPNTPLLLGEGATALAKTGNINDADFEFICNVFASCGEIQVVPENKMKEIIAINSSSPAFIYLFAKGFLDNAVKNGIDAEAAKKLFCKTLIGSAKMITDSGYSIDELIKMVSSPGGTTLAGLDKLYAHDLLKTVNDACEACTKRAYELSK